MAINPDDLDAVTPSGLLERIKSIPKGDPGVKGDDGADARARRQLDRLLLDLSVASNMSQVRNAALNAQSTL